MAEVAAPPTDYARVLLFALYLVALNLVLFLGATLFLALLKFIRWAWS